MELTPILLSWADLGLRWLHLIAGIAWIGSSFYFMALDASIKRREHLPEGVAGETWQVHGGGFYRMWKYSVAPPEMPPELTWFKWEAYTTFLSGAALLVVVYYLGAELYMLDPEKADLSAWIAALIGIAVLVLGWVAYDLLCKSHLGEDERILAAIGLVAFPLVCFLLSQIFTGRAAFLHTGALIGTIMVANVAHVIIPNQRKVVAALLAHQTPDPALGEQAKQRSVHNNYLTLPVLFVMISNHYPQTFASPFNWLILGLILIVGASIRHYFNIMHTGARAPWWPWAVAAVGAVLAILVAMVPATRGPIATAEGEAPVEFMDVENVVLGRCSMCHAREPLWPGVAYAPKGVVLETARDIHANRDRIVAQTWQTHAMPPGNITFIDDDERRLLARWLAEGASLE